MRIPGIRSIAYCPASSVPDEFEMQAMAGTNPSLVGLQFLGFVLFGEPKLELKDSNENNGSNRKVTLSFVTGTKFTDKQAAFVVTCRNGAKYLIGTKSNVPAISTSDVYGSPTSDNHLTVTVELSAPMAWMEVEGQEAAQDGDYIRYEFWQPKADELYAQKQHRHGTDEVDDDPTGQTQEQNNIDQGKKIKKAIKLAKSAL